MKLQLTDTERETLRTVQRKGRDKKGYVRATVLLMLDRGMTRETVADCLGIDVGTVSDWKKKYRLSGDMDDYLSDNYVAYTGKLTKAEEKGLGEELDRYLYRSSKEVVAFVLERFGKEYSEKGMVHLLNRIGFSYKKTVQEPSKADPEAQGEFLEGLQVLLKEAEKEGLDVYFMDGAHPQHNTRPEYGWIRTGEDFVVPANTGRRRINLNGAVNAHDPTDIEYEQTDSVNAQSTIRLLEKIRKKHEKKAKKKGRRKWKVKVICDNARYYRAKLVKEYLARHPQIELVFLPPYSPNLNLIERLWKLMRKKVINSFFYEKYEEFEDAVMGFFENIKDYRKELTSLLTHNFNIVGI